jgi:sugar fermentation stimulation protein A
MTTKCTKEMTSSPQTGSIEFGELVSARFVQRDNRFVARVKYRGEVHLAHLANPGRLEELLTPGQTLWIRPVQDPDRKTHFDVVLVELAQALVSVNSQLPNRIVGRALNVGTLPGLREIQNVRREVARGHSRIDFMVAEENHTHWIEVKSVTLVVEGTAMFPDAPTKRGTRHLHELNEIVQEGGRATVAFVIQRDDAEAFTSNETMDPAFAAALRSAATAGVEIRAWRCWVTHKGIGLDSAVPVCLDSPIS